MIVSIITYFKKKDHIDITYLPVTKSTSLIIADLCHLSSCYGYIGKQTNSFLYLVDDNLRFYGVTSSSVR